jgi:hypothetical protein
VTTVPTPASEKQRSTARRKCPDARAAGSAARVDALAGEARDRQQIGLAQRRRRQQRAHLLAHLGQALRRHQICLGQRHHAAAQAEQIEDGQVLARLRHRPVVGGHHEHHVVDAGGAGEHVADQLLVAGHVDETEHAAVGRRLVGEAEVDRDAARLFFLQPVGVDAGERLDQGGLAMVDVTCGSDDHGGCDDKVVSRCYLGTNRDCRP